MRKAWVVYKFKPVDSDWGHGAIECSFTGPLDAGTIFKFGDVALEYVNKELHKENHPPISRERLVTTNVIMLEE